MPELMKLSERVSLPGLFWQKPYAKWSVAVISVPLEENLDSQYLDLGSSQPIANMTMGPLNH